MVNFWASWCGPCRKEHGSLRAFWERYRDKGVALLGVLYDDSPGAARAFQQDLGGDWPLFKENKLATVDFGVRGPPEPYVVDQNGIIVGKITGPVSPGQLEDAIANDTRLPAGPEDKPEPTSSGKVLPVVPAAWPSGSGKGLQNPVQRFNSARRL